MGQTTFIWLVVFETLKPEKGIKYYCCTWDNLLNELLREVEQPIAIIRLDIAH